MNLSYYPIHTVVLQVTKEKGRERERENVNITCTGGRGAGCTGIRETKLFRWFMESVYKEADRER